MWRICQKHRYDELSQSDDNYDNFQDWDGDYVPDGDFDSDDDIPDDDHMPDDDDEQNLVIKENKGKSYS